MNLVFVYGTLRQTETQLSVLNRKLDMSHDQLSNYKKSKVVINGRTYPIIVPSQESDIAGSIIEVTDEELVKLDEYETSAYQRVKLL